MFTINPFRKHRANNEVLKEDPAHYAMIAKKDAEHRAKLGKKPMPNMYDKKFSLNKKKNEDMGEFSGDVKLMGDKKLKHHATTGEKNKAFSHNKIKKEYERRKSASARRTAVFGKDTTPSGKAGPSYESVGKTAGDHSYYHLQKAKDLAKKDGHDYDKLPQYDRTHDKHKDHYDARAKKEAMDPVSHKELKGKHKDRKDKDIDNDGDVDNSDKYLHKKRKAISKAVKTETFTISKASRKPRKPAIGGMQDKEQDAKNN